MLVIRLFRTGKKNQPAFKIVVTEKDRAPRGGRFIEEVGFVNRLTKQKGLKAERIKYWLSVGAQPSDTVHNLLVKEKVIEAEKIAVHKKKKAGEEKPEEKKAETAKPEEKKAEVKAEVRAEEKKEAPEEPKKETEIKQEEKPEKKEVKEEVKPEEPKKEKEKSEPKEEKPAEKEVKPETEKETKEEKEKK